MSAIEPAEHVAATHVEHSHKRQWKPYTVFAMLSAGLGSIAFGYASGVIGPTLAQPSFIEYFEMATRSDATSLASCMNGLFFAGAAIFILTVYFFADRWGRKAAIGVAAIIIAFAGAMLAGSTNVGEFIFFRFVSGAGTYMMMSAVTLWMTEVAPPAVRGVFVSLNGACLLFGYHSSCWVGYGFLYLDSPAAWRGPFAIQCLPALLLLAGLYWLPESPRWLIMKGRLDEARDNLLKLHTPEEAKIEFAQIQTQTEIDKTLPNSYWAMFARRSYRKRTLIGMGTFAAIQTSGVLVINNYGPMIYGSLGYDVNTQIMYAAAWLTLGWGGGCLALLVVDRIPRPKFIGYGLLGCQACLIIEAALVANFVGTTNTAALKAAVAMLFLFVFIYEFAMDSAQFVYLGELFPTHLRAKGVSLGCGTLALMNVMWLQVAPTAFKTIGWKFYLCFIIPGCLCAVGILLYFPDTLGLPLEEIAAIFGDKDEIFVGVANSEGDEEEAEKVVASDIKHA
ncbi:hypothetical protein PV08_03187 [Exophiala spinifera]|uniref:Major facilitator superfamily (MFS) profile domain-containing protein n=1 Tax=Exophiala spinifera TaxID=91928 RepID=A0A0D2BJ00_9EURO|nr:uncharacterized protein PV08_03187 [Exophiala spinifera]KIW18898.1 hypothetical protein PV08_03187 [Exophiala spinifera]